MIIRILILLLVIGFSTQKAIAEEHTSNEEDLTWSYLYDGGAIPFIYGSGLWAFLSNAVFSPPDTPRLFSPNEGGKSFDGDTLPPWYVAAGTGVVMAGMAALPERSRWFHVKGLLEASLTSSALTGTGKFVFGRHRPHYDPNSATDEERKSFFSGHASQTWVTMTYLGLYLRNHVFKNRRGTRWLPWWEGLTYASMATLAVYVPLTRISDNRHHPSDVITGALVGTSLATVFYFWQERRHQRASTAYQNGKKINIGLNFINPGLIASWNF